MKSKDPIITEKHPRRKKNQQEEEGEEEGNLPYQISRHTINL